MSPDRIRVLHEIGNLGPQGHPGSSPGQGVCILEAIRIYKP